MEQPDFITQAIKNLLPIVNKGYSIVDQDIESIEWFDNEAPPSTQEVKDEVTRLQAEYDANQYQRDRAAEYPAIEDQLDDIFHNGIDGWKTTIQAVKDKYPKPE